MTTFAKPQPLTAQITYATNRHLKQHAQPGHERLTGTG